MSRFRFELATTADDAELRQILAATPMAGDVSVSYRREPSFFQAAAVSGPFHQVMVARDDEAGRIAGFCVRAVRPMYVNGQPESVGYLSGVRTRLEYRNGTVLARGTARLRELHADGRAKLYLLTIAEGNQVAIGALASGRTALPSMTYAGNYLGLAIPIPTRRRRPRAAGSDWSFEEGRLENLGELLNFYRTWGPRRQFFPCYEEADFFRLGATFKDLQPHDLILARRGGRLVGVMGVWDQHGYKQSVVEGYTTGVRLASPVYNLWARLRGMPAIPQPGSELRYLSAAAPVVADDDPEVFLRLAGEALARASGGPSQYLMLGMHERDPLLPAAGKLRGRTYVGRMYLACWSDGEEFRGRVDGRPPYLELGSM